MFLLLKKFVFYIFSYDCLIELDSNPTRHIVTDHFYNTDITNLYEYFLNELNFFISGECIVSNINQMTIKTINDRCNMSYKHYMDQPMCMCEKQIILNFVRNPQLIN